MDMLATFVGYLRASITITSMFWKKSGVGKMKYKEKTNTKQWRNNK